MGKVVTLREEPELELHRTMRRFLRRAVPAIVRLDFDEDEHEEREALLGGEGFDEFMDEVVERVTPAAIETLSALVIAMMDVLAGDDEEEEDENDDDT